MDLNIEKALDGIGVKIVRELQKNARTSYSEIGRRVGLSSPAVAERIHRLEEAGVITGYHAAVDPEKMGYTISAFVHVTSRTEKYGKFYAFADATPQIVEYHCISGGESFIVRVIADSISQLDQLVNRLSEFGDTKTSIVLSSPKKKSTIEHAFV